MNNEDKKRMVSWLINEGVKMYNSGIELDKLITSDRIMVELYCDEDKSVQARINEIESVYNEFEDHIHDTIEAMVFRSRGF